MPEGYFMTRRIFTQFFGIFAPVMAAATPAFAHHPLGGETPQTLIHGVLSGIGHPIIGFDHLAFVLGIGLLAAYQKSRLILPVGFVVGTALGTMTILAGVTLPVVEPVITISVLLVGLLAMMGRVLQAGSAGVIAVAVGGFHGWAYGEAVVGAESTPIIAYIAGFTATQMVLAIAAMLAARWVIDSHAATEGYSSSSGHADLRPRLAGAVVAGIGLTYLVEITESVIFSAI
jgi:urease accessory protein